jgi:hypothetical protein
MMTVRDDILLIRAGELPGHLQTPKRFYIGI